jgi:hypothetical protein
VNVIELPSRLYLEQGRADEGTQSLQASFPPGGCRGEAGLEGSTEFFIALPDRGIHSPEPLLAAEEEEVPTCVRQSFGLRKGPGREQEVTEVHMTRGHGVNRKLGTRSMHQ